MKNKSVRLGILVWVLQAAATAVMIWIISSLNVLPNKFLFPLIVVMVLFTIWFYFLVRSNKKKKDGVGKTVARIISVLITICTVIGCFYIQMGIDKFKDIVDTDVVESDKYAVLVLADSEYQTLSDLNGKRVYSCNQFDGLGLYNNALTELTKEDVNIKIVEVEDNVAMISSLYSGEYDAVFFNLTYSDLVADEHPIFLEEVRELWSVELTDEETPIAMDPISADFDITRDCFTIYVSGMDSYGTVANKSRTDVNMLVTVNPFTHQILLTSIPRDYYVMLPNMGAKDKLTHSGMGGVANSVGALEDLFGMEIQYYVKVNFSSLVKIVDALGGVNVYSPVSFTTLHGGYYIQAGDNYLDGDKALCFVRERYHLAGGDNDRVKNQQRLIQAMIKKAISPAILTNYTKLLSAVEGTFLTNMTSDEIMTLIKSQLDNMTEWSFVSIQLNGYGQTMYGGAYMPNQALYYMIPNQESVDKAINMINKISNDEIVE